MHAAAAVGGRATILITSNIRDYPAADLGDVRVLTPDGYFVEVLSQFPDEVMTVLEEMGTQRRNPQPLDATLRALERAGLRTFAAAASELAQRDP